MNFLNQYAQLINFTLFIAIIGWLFLLTKRYSDALEKKYEAQLADKDGEINRSKREIVQLEETYKTKTEALEQTISTLKARNQTESELHKAMISTLKERQNNLQENSVALLDSNKEQWRLREQGLLNEIEFQKLRILLLEEMAKLPTEASELRDYLEKRIKEIEKQALNAKGKQKEVLEKEKGILRGFLDQMSGVDTSALKTVAWATLPLGLAFIKSVKEQMDENTNSDSTQETQEPLIERQQNEPNNT